jgi:hypothetical protein
MEQQPCSIPSKALLRDQETKRLDRRLSVVTSAFTGQYRQIARKIRVVRSETGVLERNIGFGANGGSLIGLEIDAVRNRVALRCEN